MVHHPFSGGGVKRVAFLGRENYCTGDRTGRGMVCEVSLRSASKIGHLFVTQKKTFPIELLKSDSALPETWIRRRYRHFMAVSEGRKGKGGVQMPSTFSGGG
jgi:hypothetical protein